MQVPLFLGLAWFAKEMWDSMNNSCDFKPTRTRTWPAKTELNADKTCGMAILNGERTSANLGMYWEHNGHTVAATGGRFGFSDQPNGSK